MITGKNYIGNELSAKGSDTYRTFDPKQNSDTEWTFHEATKEEIDAAVDKAYEAFQVYKTFSGEKKANFLIAISEEIEALGDPLIEAFTKESPRDRTRSRMPSSA